MPNPRRLGAPLLAITILILLSGFLLLPFGEDIARKEGITLRKRDGMTITFSLPWKGSEDTPPLLTEAKAVSPVLGGLLEDVTNVASAILDTGSNIGNEVSSQANALQTKVADNTQVSIVFNGGAGVVASIMSQVNSLVNDATGIVGGVVGDATSVVGAILGGATSTPLKTGVGAAATSSPTSSEPQEFLPQSHSVLMNMTSAATSATSSLTAAPCPAVATTTITPCCTTSTETCTVTETWHSTHYDSTQTLYSFLSVYTETVSFCPQTNPYLFSSNTTTSLSNSSLIACANGKLAKRAEDCSSSTSKDCSMMTNNGNAVPSVASIFSSVAANGNAQQAASSPSSMASFTASLPSLPSNTSPMKSMVSLIASIICADGSLVIRTQDCLDGLSSPTSISLLAFRTSALPMAAAVTKIADENDKMSNMVAHVVSALGNVPGLTGDLLSTLISDVASAVSVAHTLTANLAGITAAPAAVPTAGKFVAGIGSTLSKTVSAAEGVTGGLLAGLNRGADSATELGSLKDERLRREAPPRPGYYCEENADNEPCLSHGDGGGLLERDNEVD